jgi:hypothetical protein
MKTKQLMVLCTAVIFSFANELYSQKSVSAKKVQATDSISSPVSNKKEEKNRNEMLNASSPSQPRQINIGIPPGGDLLIMENGVPGVYQFMPQIVTSVWKKDESIGRIGLLSLAEGALTFGKIGFCVNSYDREPGSKFKGFFSARVNNFGSLVYSGNISGPIGNKGWGYVLGMHETYGQKNGINRGYSRWSDERMEMFKAGISKKYKNGNVNLLYKHAVEYLDINNNLPFIYKGNGNFTEMPGFKLGMDSYTLKSGDIAYADANSKASVKYNIGDAKYNNNTSDALYLNGNHNFKNGFKLMYTSMYMHSKSPFQVQFPLSLGVATTDANNQFFMHGTTTAYAGNAQQIVTQMIEPTNIDQSLSRVELTKKYGTHNFRLGLTEQYYATGLQKTDGAMYYQTATADPKLLDWKTYYAAYHMFVPATNADGIVTIPGSEYKIKTNKTALFLSDDFTVGKIFDFTVGGRIEKEDDEETHDQYANTYIYDRSLMVTKFNNKYNHVGVASFVAKVTHDFGFLGDITYNDYITRYYDYPTNQKDALGNPITTKTSITDANGATQSVPVAQTTDIHTGRIKVLFLGGGIYYNHGDLLSVVSKVTSSQKLNNITSMDIYDPADVNHITKMNVNPIVYDIKTLGWTTDIVTSPFKNFNLHYLLTLQNPQYKRYSVSAFGQTYSYNNNTVPALSKVLMEIDPSYQLGDFRIWASLRYFGKQYGNLSNSIYYKPWWENFAGVDYRLSRNCDMKLQVVNFLNQKGISGTLQGADQITSAMEPAYIGKIMNANAIRPRTIEFTVNLKL